MFLLWWLFNMQDTLNLHPHDFEKIPPESQNWLIMNLRGEKTPISISTVEILTNEYFSIFLMPISYFLLDRFVWLLFFRYVPAK